ncbi:hypothetical protein [uncultured Roseovarius sp.]|uniref:hypothetical protein n=1 Tax=uncultured Roseovarius sp. TaxID=293344 RepID=UPI0025F23C45|nr:hypothetical protein [uncultured Roseovarius sp.]
MKQRPNVCTASPLSQAEVPPFRNLHELSDILEALGHHLHAKNWIEIGESGYYCQLAETLGKLARLTTLPLDFPAVDEEFGHICPPGTLAHDEQTRRFLLLVESQANDAD